MTDRAFGTALTISGPYRAPRQMLATQEYGGHKSIHDDGMAEELGFKGAPIEGPTHFSQFVPLLHQLWGRDWEEHGCISAHYKNPVVEGEEVRAFVETTEHPNYARIWAEKKDGTPVLEGSATLGPDHPETALEARRKRLTPPEKLIILRDVQIGFRSPRGTVRMDFDQDLGALYPFTLADKLEVITERSDWCTADGGPKSPWGRAIVPLEMMGPLTQYTSRESQVPARGPAVGLFADLEVRMVNGPVFVGKEYTLEREVVGLSESRRTESYWILTSLTDPDDGRLVAQALLNNAVLKESFATYAEEAAAR
ncbi:MAG: hypothetical protein IIC89_07765 [Chloroflexi bacterium]|nr:hypothetical protein [Chloroflexota bacterium]